MIKIKKILKWILIIFVGLIVLGVVAGSTTQKGKEGFEKGKEVGSLSQKKEESKAVEKLNIVVTSQIIKKVDGKYRYFFDIRNNDTKNFEGSVSITIYNNLQDSALGGDTFKTNKPIEPKLGTSVYLDIFTGPTSVHGANGITKFKYEVRKGDQIVNEGEGQITTKYENLY